MRDTTVEHRIRGSGHPVVVLQSGLGDGLSVWQALQERTEPLSTTVAYSRPGYGRSRWVEGRRSPCNVADQERGFLRASGLAPPFVLVGHSLGGLYQYAFAKLYPDEVAGIVLLDPTHPEHWASVQRDAPAVAAMVGIARVAFSAPMRREFDDQTQCLERLQGLPMPRVPARVLVRGRFVGLEAGAFENVVRRLEADWVQRIGAASVQRVDASGHYLQRDRPDAVADAIAAVVQASRPR